MEPTQSPQRAVGAEQVTSKKESFVQPLNQVTILSKITAGVAMAGLAVIGFLYGYQYGLEEGSATSYQHVDLNGTSSTTAITTEPKYLPNGIVSYMTGHDVVVATNYVTKNNNLYYVLDEAGTYAETLLVESVTYATAFGEDVVHANGMLFEKDKEVEKTETLRDLNGYGSRLASDSKIYFNDGEKFLVIYDSVDGKNLKVVSEFERGGSLSPLADGGYWASIFTDGKFVYCIREKIEPISEPIEVIFSPVQNSSQDSNLWYKKENGTDVSGYVTLKQKTTGETYNTQCEKI